MNFRNKKKYNEDQHWEDTALDYDTGEPIDPNGKEKNSSAQRKKVPDDIQQVFDLFDNPAKAIWRLREIEREAAKALFETYGIETLRKRVTRINEEKKKKDPFFPEANTPSQLLDKMPNIERYLGI